MDNFSINRPHSIRTIAGESCGEQVPEQRGDLGGVGQEPEADDKNGLGQRAEAGWTEQVIEGCMTELGFLWKKQPNIKCSSTGSLGCRKRSWNEQLSELSLQNPSSRGLKKNFSWSVFLSSSHDNISSMTRSVRTWSSWSCLQRRQWRGRRSWRIRSWASSRSSSPQRAGLLFNLIIVKASKSKPHGLVMVFGSTAHLPQHLLPIGTSMERWI